MQKYLHVIKDKTKLIFNFLLRWCTVRVMVWGPDLQWLWSQEQRKE